MHSFLVAFAYMAMIFVPCACAQWGDVLTAQWWYGRFAFLAPRESAVASPMLAAIRQERELQEIEALTDHAFVRPPRYVKRILEAQALREAALVDTASLQRSAARVALRLEALAEAHRLSNTVEVATDTATPMGIVRRPPARALPHELTEAQLLGISTPSSAQLDALYALEEPAHPPAAFETPPISIAA